MTIFQYTSDKVMDGTKDLTSRIINTGDTALCLANGALIALTEGTNGIIQAVYNANGNERWHVGQIRAVQPARTAKGIGRIQITAIRAYDVRDITEDEARREGFNNPKHFWFTWCDMHDKPYKRMAYFGTMEQNMMQHLLFQRPAERYNAWQLEFRLVTE